MSLDVRVAGLPGLQVEIDLQTRLVVGSVRDLDDDGSVAIGAGFTICAPEELEQLLAGIWVNLDPHVPLALTLGHNGPFVEFPGIAGKTDLLTRYAHLQ